MTVRRLCRPSAVADHFRRKDGRRCEREIQNLKINSSLAIALTLTFPLALAGTSPGQELTFAKPETQRLLGAAYKRAVHNLLEINTVPDAEKHYNRTGLFRDPPGTFFRAGGDYHAPWTRDASINSWNAGSLLAPDVARNTLWAVCQRQAGGKLIVQRDKQWWDKVIWVVGAWSHYAITGDRDFLGRPTKPPRKRCTNRGRSTSTPTMGCSRADRCSTTASPAIPSRRSIRR